MSTQIIKEEIVRLIETIVEQNIIIHSYEKSIPRIEIDLVMENLRRLYNCYYELNRLNSGEALHLEEEKRKVGLQAAVPPVAAHFEPSIPEPTPPAPAPEPVITVEMPSEPIVAEEVVIEEVDVEEVVVEEERIPEVIMPVVEPEPQREPQPKPELQPAETMPEPLPTPEPRPKLVTPDLFGASHTLADKLKNEKKNVNDTLPKSDSDKSLGARLQKNKITDLKTAIGINEKFLFINELFKGDMQKYTESLNGLNSKANRGEADELLKTLADELKWKEDSEPYQRFLALIDRRF